MNRAEDNRVSERQLLVRLLEGEGAITRAEVREAFLRVPRHRFVPAGMQSRAYDNSALPIGLGQTISQPLMVAIMSELMEPDPRARVLEIGTGSGYQAAILSRLFAEVHTVERLPELSAESRRLFAELGYGNIHCHVGDGTLGWPEAAPYDRIIVTAGAPDIPAMLQQQLGDGGWLVIPVGHSSHQELIRLRRVGDRFVREHHGGCVFVKLIGEEGWKES